MEKVPATRDRLRNIVNEEVSRRSLLGSAVGLGLSIPVMASLLAACGGDDDDTDDSGSGNAAADEGSASSAATEEQETGESSETAAETSEESPESTEPAGTEQDAEAAGEPKQGGTLQVAMVGEPPTLDIHQTTGTIVALVAWNIYETLFAWDDEYAVIPMLAESFEVSEDGLLITVALRQGVPFHNGEEMKAADVIASIDHWAQISGLGASLLAVSKETLATDDYTIEFHLNNPYGAFAQILATASGGCSIYPKSIIDAVNGEEIKDYIGTGPYKFTERQAGSHILLERFDDYAALEGEPIGYGGHKQANVDAMRFVPVPDEAARVAGVQSGDYHYLEDVSADQHEVLKDAENVVSKVLPPAGWGIFILNTSEESIMANQKLRQAFMAALDLEAICLAGYGEGFYRLDPSFMQKETIWHSTAGQDLYNQNDPERAKQLLEESGYDGTPIRWTTTQEYKDHYNRSLVAVQQLEAVGFKFDFAVMDWATVLSEQFDKTAWDVTTTGISFDADPTTLFILDVCHVAGWWCTDEVVDLVNTLRTETDADLRYETYEKIQQHAYEYVPFVKDGDSSAIQVHSAALKGLPEQSQIGPILWNAWIEE